MKARNVFCWLAIAAFITPIAGCGDGRPKRVKVSGRVLFEGKPLAYGYVRFVPKESRAATGILDSEGRFKLGSYAEDDGIVPGTHPIQIVLSEPVSDTSVRIHAPKKYASAFTSGLTEEVKEARDNVFIELKRDKGDSKSYPYIETIE